MKRTLTFVRLIAFVFTLLFVTSCNTSTSPVEIVNSTTSTSSIVEETSTIKTSLISETTADPNSVFEVETAGKKVLKFDNLLYKDFNLEKESQQIVTFLSFLQYYNIAEKTPEDIWQYVNALPFEISKPVEDRSNRFYFGDYKSQNIGFSGSFACEEFINSTLKANNKKLSCETVLLPKYISIVTKYIDNGQPVIYYLNKNLGSSKENSFDFTYTSVATRCNYSYDITFVVIVGYDYDCLYYYDSGSPELKEYKWVSGFETGSWFHAIVPIK